MSKRSSGSARSSCLVLFVGGLALLAGVRPRAVEAAPVTSQHASVQISGDDLADLKAFLAGGPRMWAHTPPPKLPAGLTLTEPDGALKNNNLVAFLSWMQDKNPEKFDRKHPHIAAIFAQSQGAAVDDQTVQAQATTSKAIHSTALEVLGTPVPSSSSVTTPRPAARPVAEAQSLVPEAETLAVPEPSTLALALLVFGSAAWWRGRGA